MKKLIIIILISFATFSTCDFLDQELNTDLTQNLDNVTIRYKKDKLNMVRQLI